MRKYKTGRSGAAALVVALLAAAVTRADYSTVTATLNANHTLDPSAAVTINLGDMSTPSVSYTPGVVNWTQTGTRNQQNALLPTDFTTFCIELTKDVYIGSTDTYTLVPLENAPNPGSPQTQSSGPGSGMGAAKAKAIGELWQAYYPGIASYTDPKTKKSDPGDDAAAFQLAIWKIEYDWNVNSPLLTPSFSTGNFRASGNDAAIGIANGMLTYVETNYKALPADPDLVALSNPNIQGQIGEASSNPFVNTVPVPSTFCLIGAGGLCLFGYGLMRRRVAVA